MSWQTLATENLFVGVICTSLIGLLFQICLEKLEHWLLPWSRLATVAAALLILVALLPDSFHSF